MAPPDATPLPDAIDAERVVLGALLLRPGRVVEVPTLSPSSFTYARHRAVFRAIRRAAAETTDPGAQLVLASLRAEGALEDAETGALVTELIDNGVGSRDLAPFVARIRDAEIRRDAVLFAHQLAEAASNGSSVEEVAGVVRAYSAALSRTASKRDLIRIDIAHLDAELEAIPWIVQGWAAEGEVCWFGGEWASGKSVVALDLAVSVAAGIPWMGKVPVVSPGPVLYVDEENSPRLARHRVRLLCAGRNIDPEFVKTLPIFYLVRNGLNLTSETGIATLRGEIERTGVKLAILDSFVRFIPGINHKKSEEFAPWMERAIRPICRDLNATVVILDHMRKPTGDDKDVDTGHRIEGTQDKASIADEVWTLEGDRQTDRRTLSHRKTRWDDLCAPLTTRWIRSEDRSAAWIEASDEALSVEVVILGALAASGLEGMRAGDLEAVCAARGFHRATTFRTLGALVSKGTVGKTREGQRGVRYRDLTSRTTSRTPDQAGEGVIAEIEPFQQSRVAVQVANSVPPLNLPPKRGERVARHENRGRTTEVHPTAGPGPKTGPTAPGPDPADRTPETILDDLI